VTRTDAAAHDGGADDEADDEADEEDEEDEEEEEDGKLAVEWLVPGSAEWLVPVSVEWLVPVSAEWLVPVSVTRVVVVRRVAVAGEEGAVGESATGLTGVKPLPADEDDASGVVTLEMLTACTVKSTTSNRLLTTAAMSPGDIRRRQWKSIAR
jgi:hypothetical protein